MDDAKLAAACALLALLSAAILVFLARQAPAEKVGIGSLGTDDVGRLVEVSGAVASVSQTGGNFFLRVCADKCVKVAVFKSLAEEMRRSSLDLSLLRPGGSVSAAGIVREYGDEIEIVPFDRNSIDVLGSAG